MARTKQQTQATTVYAVLYAISGSHLINDSIQSVVQAMNPIFEQHLHLTFAQIGWIAFVLNMTSSVMQPVFGNFADRKATPFLLPAGMSISTLGLIGFALSSNFYLILISVFLIGIGSAVFHPEGSRVAYMAAGSKRGLAQSIYQVGGNFGQSLAPVFTAFIFVPLGQKGALAFVAVTAAGIILLTFVSRWYKGQLQTAAFSRKGKNARTNGTPIHPKVKAALVLLVFLVFARSWYVAGINNFYQFYLIEDYGVTVRHAQLYVFIFMFAGVLGTFFGGPLADRFGRRNILAASMLGAAPLTLVLPYVPLPLVIPIFFLIGFIMLSSFSVAVVYAQELLPKKVGMVSGLIVGLAFGMGAVGAVALGTLGDMYSIRFVMILCSLLPLAGIFTWLLPSDDKVKKMTKFV
jgi:FSR family fosmidomycin resistance protein-like MFS transporter